jgi:GAF domain-containing protein
MNVDRLLRDVEARLQEQDPELRAAALDVLREAIARERRREDPSLTVEAERERRVEAEEMREMVEAIDRPASTEAALAEAVKQAARAVEVDVTVVTAFEAGGAFRVVAALGAQAEPLVGALLDDPRLVPLLESRVPAAVSGSELEEVSPPFPLPLRSWIAVPMLHEGEPLGLLFLGRLEVASFTENELHRARRVAFAVAAVLARGRQLDQVRRYAVLLEQVVEVDHRVFRGEGLETLGQALLDGACRVGGYRAGLLVIQTPRGPLVAAAVGEPLQPAVGRPAPAELAATALRRLPLERVLDVAEHLGIVLPACDARLVPVAAPDDYVGCLCLLDPAGPSLDEVLVEAYASRAAVAWRHASGRRIAV